ncbi:MAG: histidinol dehydrogenase, partial [Verrucomicrobiota bacterium]|nr:histidinol dehydrogenase [Verrucomicrobiota bacterium]
MKVDYLRDGSDLLSELSAFATSASTDAGVMEVVSDIIASVKKNGDSALLEKTKIYDHAELQADDLRISQRRLDQSIESLSGEDVKALEEAIDNVRSFHLKSFPKNWSDRNSHGAEVGERYYPIQRVGLYVPGGNVPLVSTVIMTVTLAQVAEVPEIAVVTPPNSEGMVAPQLLGALRLLEVSEVYSVGGAQAIAALAHGTESIPAVDKIFGPGNAYVNEAKRQVFGTVGVDLLPGPSEVMVLADETANPQLTAAALLAQAEHGSGKEKVYFLFNTQSLFPRVMEEIKKQISSLSHGKAIEEVLEKGFRPVLIEDLSRMAEVATFIAPEHLEL